MIKNLTILSNNQVLVERDYGIGFIDPDALPRLLKDLDNELTSRGFFDDDATTIDIITTRIVCYKNKKPDIFVSLTVDDSIVPKNLHPSINKLISVTKNYIKTTLSSNNSIFSKENKEALEKECEPIIKDLMLLRPPKISIIGYDMVGKTSICELIKGANLPEKYRETTSMEKFRSELFGIPILVWDIPDAGDLNNERMWGNFIKGSDGVILVLDSSRKNAEESKSMIQLTDEIVPHAELLIVANKQDVEGALTPEELESILLCKVFPFSANTSESSEIIQKQVAELLEIKAEGIDYSDKSYIIQRND